MIKNILNIAFTVAAGSFLLISCSSDEVEETEVIETHENHHHINSTEYYCPMKCEGEKTYFEKGKCSSCGMNLLEKK